MNRGKIAFAILPAILQADAIVTALNEAVPYFHVRGMVEVDAIAVSNLQLIQQNHVVNLCPIATHKVNGPIGSVL